MVWEGFVGLSAAHSWRSEATRRVTAPSLGPVLIHGTRASLREVIEREGLREGASGREVALCDPKHGELANAAVIASCLRERHALGDSYTTGEGIIVAVRTEVLEMARIPTRRELASRSLRLVTVFVPRVPRLAFDGIRPHAVELPAVGSRKEADILRHSGMG